MRILVDTTFVRRGRTGTGVYIERLVAGLRAEGVEVVEASNRLRRPPAGGGLGSAVNLATDRAWTELGLLAAAERHRVDVIHHPLPAHTTASRRPQVVTVHDLAFVRAPELFDRRWAGWAAVAHRRAAERAALVIAPSAATARDILELWGLEATVIHHGPGQVDGPLPRRDQPRHFLYVGDDEPRKALGTLRDAHAQLGPAAAGLVVVGAAGERVTAGGLRDLHAGAVALVHPARIEGFGLTLVEAMALGTPVIAGRSAAAEEVCGPAAVYCDPDKPGELAAAMARVAGDAELRGGLSAAGLERARQFSWAASARGHAAAYTLAAGR